MKCEIEPLGREENMDKSRWHIETMPAREINPITAQDSIPVSQDTMIDLNQISYMYVIIGGPPL